MDWGNYLFGFRGRVNRAKMWLLMLLVFACEIPFMIAQGVPIGVGPNRSVESMRNQPWNTPSLVIAPFALFGIGVTYIYVAVAVKRLHDRDKSGWWLLVFLGVPLLFFGAAMAVMHVFYRDMQTPPTPALLAFAALAIIAEGVNLWALIELFFLPGTDGANRFGPDPLAQDHSL